MRAINKIFLWLADANNLTAISTGVIAAFTIILAFVGTCQARLTRRAIELGNREYIATNRPKIAIREPRFFLPVEGQPTQINFILENCGGSPLHVQSASLSLQVTMPAPPILPILAENRNDVGVINLTAGESTRITWISQRPYRLAEASAITTEGDTAFFFLGRISFEDNNHISRQIAFCRRFNVRKHRFCLIPDTEDEYGNE